MEIWESQTKSGQVHAWFKPDNDPLGYVNQQVDILVLLLLRNFVWQGYRSISEDQDFMLQVKSVTKHAFRELDTLLKRLDKVQFTLHDLFRVVSAHMSSYRQLCSTPGTVSNPLTNEHLQIYASLLYSLTSALPGSELTPSQLPMSETALQVLSEALVFSGVFPQQELQSPSVQYFLLDTVSHILFEETLTRLSKPAFIYEFIYKLASDDDLEGDEGERDDDGYPLCPNVSETSSFFSLFQTARLSDQYSDTHALYEPLIDLLGELLAGAEILGEPQSAGASAGLKGSTNNWLLSQILYMRPLWEPIFGNKLNNYLLNKLDGLLHPQRIARAIQSMRQALFTKGVPNFSKNAEPPLEDSELAFNRAHSALMSFFKPLSYLFMSSNLLNSALYNLLQSFSKEEVNYALLIRLFCLIAAFLKSERDRG